MVDEQQRAVGLPAKRSQRSSDPAVAPAACPARTRTPAGTRDGRRRPAQPGRRDGFGPGSACRGSGAGCRSASRPPGRAGRWPAGPARSPRQARTARRRGRSRRAGWRRGSRRTARAARRAARPRARRACGRDTGAARRWACPTPARPDEALRGREGPRAQLARDLVPRRALRLPGRCVSARCRGPARRSGCRSGSARIPSRSCRAIPWRWLANSQPGSSAAEYELWVAGNTTWSSRRVHRAREPLHAPARPALSTVATPRPGQQQHDHQRRDRQHAGHAPGQQHRRRAAGLAGAAAPVVALAGELRDPDQHHQHAAGDHEDPAEQRGLDHQRGADHDQQAARANRAAGLGRARRAARPAPARRRVHGRRSARGQRRDHGAAERRHQSGREEVGEEPRPQARAPLHARARR